MVSGEEVFLVREDVMANKFIVLDLDGSVTVRAVVKVHVSPVEF